MDGVSASVPSEVHGASTPLRVERLFLRGFRNLERLDFEPGARFNVIHGDNGAGKSNLLEAIHYMGSLRSFRGAKTEDIVRLHEPTASSTSPGWKSTMGKVPCQAPSERGRFSSSCSLRAFPRSRPMV